jgi:hypothetical protein
MSAHLLMLVAGSMRFLALVVFLAFVGVAYPAHADCDGDPHADVDKVVTRVEGNVTRITTICKCKSGYSHALRGHCEPPRFFCTENFNSDLVGDLRDCPDHQPSFFSCLSGTGITAASLACLSSLPENPRSKAALLIAAGKCGIAFRNIPFDAALKCKDVSNNCITDALAKHKRGVASCEAH